MPTQALHISKISVRGFKSIDREMSIELVPLTILAGANSSGKSSIMQPLLLIKQTLEANGDPGALLLDGPHVRLTSFDQALNKGKGNAQPASFTIKLESSHKAILELSFERLEKTGFDLSEMTFSFNNGVFKLTPLSSHKEIESILPDYLRKLAQEMTVKEKNHLQWRMFRERCFLSFALVDMNIHQPVFFLPSMNTSTVPLFSHFIQNMIHLPGLRGNPRRSYDKNTTGPRFQGTFDEYHASLIYKWGNEDKNKLRKLARYLTELGLTWKVEAKGIGDTQVELKVGRLPCGKPGRADLVNIADVGLGVSQVLPVLVALIEAAPGQLVYLEQPEIHLHPKAQRLLGRILAEAAKRGVIVVVETHSILLLREIQTLIAQGNLQPEDVRFHWMQRGSTGATEITSVTPGTDGSYGKWPVDFDTVELDAEQAYLDAVEMRGVEPAND